MIQRVESSSTSAPGINGEVTSILHHRLAEVRFQAVVESITDYAVYMLDHDGTIATWNAGAERISGYGADDVIGRHFSSLYPAEAVKSGRHRVSLKEAAERHRFEVEGWRVRKDGSRFWAHATITAVRDLSGQVCGFVKTMRDTTQRTRLAQLEATANQLNLFIATLGHELRDHLAPLRNSIGILQTTPDVAPQLANCRDAIDRQLGQLTRLVDEVLDLGRIQAGKFKLDFGIVAVRDVVERAVESVQVKANASAQRIDISVPDDPVFVHGDKHRLVQVLHNLLDNASKFSPKDAPIAVSVATEGELVEIRVTDHGPGIAPAALDTIFDVFEQHGAVGSMQGGLGLGLALCQSFVRLHEGTISTESAGRGHGATFTVRLPITRAAPVGLSANEVDIDAPPTTPLRILVVDDNRDSADTLGGLLRTMGHDARAAYRAEDALAQASTYRPQLLVVDLAMPGGDGFELLRQLRESADLAGTACVAMSGYTRPSDHERTQRAGFDAHLAKPVEISALQAVLWRVGRASHTPRD
ncbi:hybrid sensor histidine kinase/response regulator [Burkholderia sp. Nafp2/4-1b]|uniref:hybrid sensor histidine kinase/response regulator n=1 Tax=Burkholderia sp. Nafp2/4-1b TaxID=2116686 RepID=UPI000EF90159|nr:ATP-binding protein [Burkholderia sp. Nafp2/4-1b]RKU01063.1 hybrid sensor histidine kinase/response regulator [Burkholderia sp. Nafp2/4-1b]